MIRKTPCAGRSASRWLLFLLFVSVGPMLNGATATLSWGPSPDPDVVDYHVYRSETEGGAFLPLTSAPTPSTFYVDDGLQAGANYYYYVTAVNFSGAESGPSAVVMKLVETDGNRSPIAQDDAATTKEDTAVSIDVLANDSDPDGDSLSIDGTVVHLGGSAVPSGGEVLFTPDPGFTGDAHFSYFISDGRGGTAAADVVVSVSTIEEPQTENQAPVAVEDSGSTKKRKPLTLDLLSNDSDPDGDALTLLSVSDPLHGTISINGDGSITYQADNKFAGSEELSYVVGDGRGGEASALIKIQVER